ncbi:YdaU family protein [Achromobacter sp. UBA4530]|uniref:YdaU family protein n=1 Tax=Achromobacter sp. UBA4530 TaxID=1945912 RepID=UPI00257D456E|nr:YdaU family protein [Achromobacter sp. UBA4530]
MNYYSHNIGDYAQATTHLSLVEDAIYSRLLRRYYAEEEPIVDNLAQIFRWVGARTDEEKEATAQILAEYFQLHEGYWRNKRADAEIAAYHVKAETAKANGKRGGRPRKEGPGVNPPETGSQANQEPETKNQELKETPPSPRARVNGFDASTIELPDWLDREEWCSWVADRRVRRKPVTQEAARRQLQQLAAYLAEGHQPGAVIANSIAGGYQGLYPPRVQAQSNVPASRAQRLADWTDDLRDVLASDGRPREKFMGTIDASH